MSGDGGRPFPLDDPRRVLYVGWWLVAAIVLLLLAERVGPIRELVLDLDHAALRFVGREEVPAALPVSRVFALVGGAVITTPLRIVVGLAFAVGRRWWHLGAWLVSIAVMEVVTTLMKVGFDRPRPPDALEPTRLGAFPSGHAGATAVTIVVLLLLLVPGGPTRRRWWVVGAVLLAAMSASRIYLRVHWPSDVLMGVLVGSAAGVLAVAAVALLAERRARPRGVRDRG